MLKRRKKLSKAGKNVFLQRIGKIKRRIKTTKQIKKTQ